MPSKPEHSFLEARAAYHEQRKHQRQLIATALTSAGFKVTNGHRAGKGVENYVSGGELSRPYDLSNWLWVKGTRDGLRVTVTLQVLDQDPKSKNIHALIDRIGIKVAVDEPTKKKRNPTPDCPPEKNPLFKSARTKFELPLSDSDLVDLLAEVEERVKKFVASQ